MSQREVIREDIWNLWASSKRKRISLQLCSSHDLARALLLDIWFPGLFVPEEKQGVIRWIGDWNFSRGDNHRGRVFVNKIIAENGRRLLIKHVWRARAMSWEQDRKARLFFITPSRQSQFFIPQLAELKSGTVTRGRQLYLCGWWAFVGHARFLLGTAQVSW